MNTSSTLLVKITEFKTKRYHDALTERLGIRWQEVASINEVADTLELSDTTSKRVTWCRHFVKSGLNMLQYSNSTLQYQPLETQRYICQKASLRMGLGLVQNSHIPERNQTLEITDISINMRVGGKKRG